MGPKSTAGKTMGPAFGGHSFKIFDEPWQVTSKTLEDKKNEHLGKRTCCKGGSRHNGSNMMKIWFYIDILVILTLHCTGYMNYFSVSVVRLDSQAIDTIDVLYWDT